MCLTPGYNSQSQGSGNVHPSYRGRGVTWLVSPGCSVVVLATNPPIIGSMGGSSLTRDTHRVARAGSRWSTSVLVAR